MRLPCLLKVIKSLSEKLNVQNVLLTDTQPMSFSESNRSGWKGTELTEKKILISWVTSSREWLHEHL